MLEFPKLTCHLAIGYITKVEFSERSSHYTTANVMHMHQQRMVFFFLRLKEHQKQSSTIAMTSLIEINHEYPDPIADVYHFICICSTLARYVYRYIFFSAQVRYSLS